MSDRPILLTEYVPKSELVVESHYVKTPRFPAIDIHTHFGSLVLGDNYEEQYDTGKTVEIMKSYGLKQVINLDGMWGSELDRMMKKIHPYEDFITTFGSLDVSKLDESGFEKYVVQTIRESIDKGIKGLKFWKNISLVLKDKNGKYIPIDDKRLKVIWETAAEYKLPVLIHIADPVAFFKPIDRYNERYEELQAHPDWSFCNPELYSFEELMEMQENLLASNPNTTFIVAHAGSYAENLSCVSKWLDKYPNMYIDFADRIAEAGRQPYTARKFFIRYQDRILFGTDATPLDIKYHHNYRFLETWDEYFDYSDKEVPPQGRWKIYGIGLEDDVLEKIYYKNSERIIFGK